MATARQRAAARRNIKKAQAALRRKRGGRKRRSPRRAKTRTRTRTITKIRYRTRPRTKTRRRSVRRRVRRIGRRARGPLTKLSKTLYKLNPLVALAAFFFGATQKNAGDLSTKGSAFIEIVKNPTAHLPSTADEYFERLKASTPVKLGAIGMAYGYLGGFIPRIRLPLRGAIKKLGTMAVIGGCAGALIDPPNEELFGGRASNHIVGSGGMRERGILPDPAIMRPIPVEW